MRGCLSLLPLLYYTLVKRASARKNHSRLTQRNESTRSRWTATRATQAKRRRKLVGWIADGPRGEGFGPSSLVESGSAEVKGARIVSSTGGTFTRDLTLLLRSLCSISYRGRAATLTIAVSPALSSVTVRSTQPFLARHFSK
jgi:hypothetical protein